MGSFLCIGLHNAVYLGVQCRLNLGQLLHRDKLIRTLSANAYLHANALYYIAQVHLLTYLVVFTAESIAMVVHGVTSAIYDVGFLAWA